MACGTTHAFLNVNRVIEVSKISKVVNARPADRRAVLKTISNRLEDVARSPDLGVTVHADRGRWDASKRRRLNRRMTVAAINAEPGHVVLMAKRYGLRPRHILISDI